MAVWASIETPGHPTLYAAVAALGHGLAAGLLPNLEHLAIQLDTLREPLCTCPMFQAPPILLENLRNPRAPYA